MLFCFGTVAISWEYLAEILIFYSWDKYSCNVVAVRWRKTLLVLWCMCKTSELRIKTFSTELTQCMLAEGFWQPLLQVHPIPPLNFKYRVNIISIWALDALLTSSPTNSCEPAGSFGCRSNEQSSIIQWTHSMCWTNIIKPDTPCLSLILNKALCSLPGPF